MTDAGEGRGHQHDTAALTEQDWERLQRGGDIRGMPLSCDYCQQPAAWAAEPLYDPVAGLQLIWVACDNPDHIARAQQEKLPSQPERRVRAAPASERPPSRPHWQ